MKKEIRWNSAYHSLLFDIERGLIVLDGEVSLLNPVTNEKLLLMCKENKIYPSPHYYEDSHIMYYCTRKILEGSNVNGKRYIDILVYNDALKTVGDRVYNRSIGHRNDVNEVEIHQVLSGKVLELVENKGHRYLGIFGAGEYFEIPAGAFHCTYVLEDSTIVANIFGNVFWENNYSIKPYNTDNNSVVVSCSDGKHLLEADGGVSVILDDCLDNLNEARCAKYSELEEEFIISKKYSVNNTEDIFDLFNRMTCKEEKEGA